MASAIMDVFMRSLKTLRIVPKWAALGKPLSR